MGDQRLRAARACDRLEVRIDGYVDGERVLRRKFSAETRGDHLAMQADDEEIWWRPTGRTPPGSGSAPSTGPGVLVGDNPFHLGANGGVGAVWVRSLPGKAGAVRLTAQHDELGTAEATVITRP